LTNLHSKNQNLITDVIVIGGGGAGLAAAVSASEEGAEVILFEKMEKVGGTTAMAIGSITGSCTPLQNRKGIEDNIEDFIVDSKKFVDDFIKKSRESKKLSGDLTDRDNFELRRLMAEESPKIIKWLEDLGVGFFGPFPEPPHRVPRMHNAVPDCKAYIKTLLKHAKHNGVRIITEAEVVKLNIKNNNSKINSIEVKIRGEKVTASAKSAIILATGDYSANLDLKKQFFIEGLAEALPVNPNATGDGHIMARDIGAALVNMDIAYGPQLRFIPPEKLPWLKRMPYFPSIGNIMAKIADITPKFIFSKIARQLITSYMRPSLKIFENGAILINKEGQRFANEMEEPVAELIKQKDMEGYIFFNKEIAQKFNDYPYYISTAPGIAYAYFKDYKISRPDLLKSGTTLEELAAKLNIKENILNETVIEYSKLRGKTDKFGKEVININLNEGPYYTLGPLKPVYTGTEGGVKINKKCQVLRDDGSIIPNLYAAGASGQGGLILAGHGIHYLWIFVSGKIAGREAAKLL